MELRQLKYFIRIVELGSLSRAAADLHIAQPALSQQLASLESEFGTRLLARSARGVSPTDAGHLFYRHSQVVLRQLERLRSEVSYGSEGPSGLVRVGMPPSAANLLAVPLVHAVQQRLPNVRLHIHESDSGHLEELVATARIEMSLLFERSAAIEAAKGSRPTPASYLRVQPLLQEDLLLLTAGGGLEGAPLTLAQAARERFVLPGSANSTRQMIEDIWQRAGYDLNIVAELESIATIKTVVASGLAATILSASALSTSERERLTARRILGADLRRRVSLCTYDIVALGTAAEQVMKLIVELTRKLVQDGTWRGASLLPI